MGATVCVARVVTAILEEHCLQNFFHLLSSGSHEPATGKLKESFPR
ncbi:hypothetical protein DAI22_12g117800 [Oryza sativa Japonica Group]|nr:hypothetical protein DAI22_12g117800 [Oryza sativa Japonica Group]